ncbi:MAG: response regulator [Cyanobacteria bacterium SZAS-4]|nr:response regulator [Cyanobacteria bacterium SZAS-4]
MTQQLQILLAEDNYPDALYFRQLMDRTGVPHTLHVCEDGDEALNYLLDVAAGKRAIPDIILLDINLPKRSGLEVLGAIRQNAKLEFLPVVIISGSDDPDDLKRTNDLRASYIQKPADLGKLCNVISVLEHAYFVVDNALEKQITHSNKAATNEVRRGKDSDAEFSLLLVEDSPHDTRLVGELLKIADDTTFDICSVASLAEAIAATTETSYDVVALDLGLPDSIGLSGFVKLQAHIPDTPIVITTGSDEQVLGREAVTLGAQDYIVKNAQNYGELFVRSLKYAIHRKRAEVLAKGSLLREHHVLQEALEKAPIFVMRIDRNFLILDVNSTTEIELGQNRASLVGHRITDILPDVDQCDLRCLVAEGVPFRHQGHSITRTATKKRQDVFWDVLAWPVQARDQVVTEAIILAIDVSEKVRAEQQRDEFVQTLAHDIKNPVLGENRVLTALLERYASEIQPSAVAGGLQAILKSNESLIHMLTNLLEAYKIDSNLYRPTIVSIHAEDLISRAVLEFATLFTVHKINVVTKVIDVIPSINGDPIALQRLIMNILHNAVDYTPPDGEVRIVTRLDGASMVIEISNTGTGIPADEVKVLFQRFAPAPRGHKRIQSSGLGLYICRRIVEAHHGSISCTSSENLTTFTINLPVQLTDDDLERPALVSSFGPPQANGR